MNSRRLAEIHRRLAELHRELATIYADEPANDAEPKMEPPRKTKEEIRDIVQKKLARRGIRSGDPFT
jgi:hypothetical protein